MTLRTRIPYPSGATSGPGRPRLSDSRLRYRRERRRPPAEAAAAVRSRAEALLGGGGPPQAPASPLPPSPVSPAAPSVPPPRTDPPDGVSGAPPGEAAELSPALSSGSARRLAVRERLPVWLQARCAVEPRTVAAVGVVLAAAVGVAAQQYWSARPQPVTAPAVVAPGGVSATAPALAATGATPGPAGAGGRVVVDVSGAVREPGVRRLPAGSRVEDALAAAGGVRPGTDTSGLNRARVLVDGEQVLVGAPAQPPPGGAGPSPGPVSLGTATVEQLDGLPGVGPVLAQHIVDFRTANGGFRSVEELRQVNGIGERRFADLRTLVRP
ncbi:helix-hairpin-helix domain-containing protein [Streptomyces sp. NPDC057011]|uniref:helix-hairpin-helix domain-containing protein n=1 Tax=unclassified Streptomyces TaxID=2593676 RepID=UPI00363A8152